MRVAASDANAFVTSEVISAYAALWVGPQNAAIAAEPLSEFCHHFLKVAALGETFRRRLVGPLSSFWKVAKLELTAASSQE